MIILMMMGEVCFSIGQIWEYGSSENTSTVAEKDLWIQQWLTSNTKSRSPRWETLKWGIIFVHLLEDGPR